MGCFRNCLVACKSKGYGDKKIISVLSPCLGLCWWFLWARQAKGNVTRHPVQHPTASECTPGLCLQQCRVLPKPPWFSHSNPLFHPSSHAPWWSSPSCRYLLQVPLSLSQIIVISWALLSSSLSWFLDSFQLDDVFCWSWLLFKYIG